MLIILNSSYEGKNIAYTDSIKLDTNVIYKKRDNLKILMDQLNDEGLNVVDKYFIFETESNGTIIYVTPDTDSVDNYFYFK